MTTWEAVFSGSVEALVVAPDEGTARAYMLTALEARGLGDQEFCVQETEPPQEGVFFLDRPREACRGPRDERLGMVSGETPERCIRPGVAEESPMKHPAAHQSACPCGHPWFAHGSSGCTIDSFIDGPCACERTGPASREVQ